MTNVSANLGSKNLLKGFLVNRIIYTTGDVSKAKEKYIAHGCNARGVMGSGVAKAIRARFPECYEFYRWNFVRSGLQLGDVITWEEPIEGPFAEHLEHDKNKVVFNCISQQGYGRDPDVQYVSYDAVKSCVEQINQYFERTETKSIIPTVAFSKIGAGLGNGDWSIIERILATTAEFHVKVYEL